MLRYVRYCVTCALIVVVCLASVLAEKVKVGYDRGVDFANFKTYSWAELPPARLPMLRLNIIGAIDEQLAAKGLAKVDTDGDLMVSFSGDMFGELNQGVNAPAYPGYAGQPPGINSSMWTGAAGAGAPGVSVTYPKGTLVVELMDTRAARITWRAAGSVKLDIEKKSESVERINKMIASMFAQYPPRKQ